MSMYFSEEHVWLRVEGDEATVGITEHAQNVLGDVVFVQLPEVGQMLQAGAVAGVVESVKAAADVFAPASGRVLAVNEALRADPALANSDPLGAGWFFRLALIQPEELGTLLDTAAYQAFQQNA